MTEPTYSFGPGFPHPVMVKGMEFVPGDGFFLAQMTDNEGQPERILLLMHCNGRGLQSALDAESARAAARSLNAAAAMLENRASAIADAAFASARAKKGGAA